MESINANQLSKSEIDTKSVKHETAGTIAAVGKEASKLFIPASETAGTIASNTTSETAGTIAYNAPVQSASSSATGSCGGGSSFSATA